MSFQLPSFCEELAKGDAKCFIAEEGKAKVTIVIPANAGGVVKFAAAELKAHLDKMVGAEFIITRAAGSGKAIYLGDQAASVEQGIDADKIARDGYVIQSAHGDLFIVGKDEAGLLDIPQKLAAVDKASFSGKRKLMNSSEWSFNRGTLYGVYRFLEELGVRWFVAGPMGVRLPTERDIVYQGQIKEAPYFRSRQVGAWNVTPFPYIRNDRVHRNRDFTELETMGITPAVSILWNMRMRGSSQSIPLNHHPPALNWKQRYGKQHAEYFALLSDGKRDVNYKEASYRDHLCYSNADVMRVTLDEINAFRAGENAAEIGVIKKITDRYDANNGWPTGVASGHYFSVTPHDSYRMCYCDDCKKMAAPEGTPYPKQASKMVWRFVESCAVQVAAGKFPDTKIVALAYSSYSHPYPGMEKLPENVIVGLCPKDLNRPYLLHYKDNFSQFENLVTEWNDLSKGPVAFWMHFLSRWARPANYAVPVHTPEMYERVVEVMRQHGRWVYIQQNMDSVMYELFNQYLLLRKCYSPDLKAADIFDDYIGRFYGPQAGPIIKNVYNKIGTRSVQHLREKSGRAEIWNQFYTQEFIRQCRQQIEEAKRLSKGSQYEGAVGLFSKYYIGLLEKGQDVYDKNIRQTMGPDSSKLSFVALRGPIKIDGVMNELAWDSPARKPYLYNNINGKATKWSTRVAVTRSASTLYFGFICPDPKTMDRQSGDSIDIYLDPDHDHNSYYQLNINLDGKITDTYFEGNGERGNLGWSSKAEVAIKRHQDKWVVEVAIPRASFPEDVSHPSYPWGVNLGRTMSEPDRESDRISTWSKIIGSDLHRPDLFGHFFFTN